MDIEQLMWNEKWRVVRTVAIPEEDIHKKGILWYERQWAREGLVRKTQRLDERTDVWHVDLRRMTVGEHIREQILHGDMV